MSWADIKKRYERGRINSQSTEDMVARRILRALGLTDKKLYEFECDNGIRDKVQEDTPLLDRAEAAAAVVGGLSLIPEVREVKSGKEAETNLMELMEGGYTNPRNNRIVYRVKRGKDVRVLIAVRGNAAIDTANLPLPCALARGKEDDIVLIDCAADVYFNSVLGGLRRE